MESFDDTEIKRVTERLKSDQNMISKNALGSRIKSVLFHPSPSQKAHFIDEVFASGSNVISGEEFSKRMAQIGDKVDPGVRSLSITFLATGLSVGIIIPMMPALAHQLELSSTHYGAIISSFALAKMLGNFPAARLVDTYGRKKLIVGGLTVLAVGNLQMIMSLSSENLLLCRIISGIGVAGFSTAATAFLSDVSTSRNRARSIAPPMTAFSIGTALGPAIGGLLSSSLGMLGTFSTVGVLFFGVAGANHFWLKEPFLPELVLKKKASCDSKLDQESRFGAWKRLLLQPDINRITALHMVYWFVLSGAQMIVLPLLLAGPQYGLSISELGYVFAAMSLISVVGTPISGGLLDKYGKIRLILPASLSVGLMMCGSSQVQELPYFLPFLFAWTAAGTVLSSGPHSFIADAVPPVDRSRGLALIRVAGDLGMLAGSLSAGLMNDWMGAPNVILIDGLLLSAFAGFTWLRFARDRKPGIS